MENLIEPLLAGCPYSQFRPPTIQFCEANLCSYVTQPANTISNFAFFVSAYWIFFKTERKNFFLSFSFAVLCSLIGIFSALYHASFTFFMQFFDLSSMFLLANFLISLNLYRMGIFTKSLVYFNTFFLTAFSCMLLINFKRYGIPIFAFFIFLTVLTEFLLKLKYQAVYKNFLISLIIFLLGFAFWCLDFFRIWCNPNQHFIQGHGIWHILTAVSIYFLFLFYSENIQIEEI